MFVLNVFLDYNGQPIVQRIVLFTKEVRTYYSLYIFPNNNRQSAQTNLSLRALNIFLR